MNNTKTRSRNGCLTCRKRKLKCDELHPECARCHAHGFSCSWPVLKGIRKSPIVRETSAPSLIRQLPPHQVPRSLAPKGMLMQCPNSVIIKSSDQILLEYFPSSLTQCFFDFGEQSLIKYIVTELAPSHSGVLHMILALSATEMHKKGIALGANSTTPSEIGLHYHSLALQELQLAISHHQRSDSVDGVEAMLVAIFLMVNYESQFHDAESFRRRIKAHVAGLWALISTHSLFQDAEQVLDEPGSYSAAALALSCKVILWLLYTDTMATSFGSSYSLHNRLAQSSIPTFAWDRLTSLARLANMRVWGPRYCPIQHLRDMNITHTIELGYEVLTFRFRAWHYSVYGVAGDGTEVNASSLLQQLSDLREKFSDIILFADGGLEINWDATVEAPVRIAGFYWACLLYYIRLFDPSNKLVNRSREAVTKLTTILLRLDRNMPDRRSLARVAWPLLMAAVSTHDPMHRDWFLEKLKGISTLTQEASLLYSVAMEMVALEERGACSIDILRFGPSGTQYSTPVAT